MSRASEFREHGLRALVVALALLAALCSTKRQDTAPACDAGATGGSPGVPPDVGMRLMLNLPAYRLDVYANDSLVRTFGVAIGGTRYPTPTGEFLVTRTVWNPWWIPPDSPWARHEKITPPGDANPMGRVKLQLRGPYFLHGTPWGESIGRAASHGCIRLRQQDAITLATLVLDASGVALPRATIDSLVLGPLHAQTRDIALPAPVALRIVYDLVEMRGDSLYVYPDVYGRAPRPPRALALEALAVADRDTSAVRRASLDALLRRARRGAVALPLDSLAPPTFQAGRLP